MRPHPVLTRFGSVVSTNQSVQYDCGHLQHGFTRGLDTVSTRKPFSLPFIALLIFALFLGACSNGVEDATGKAVNPNHLPLTQPATLEAVQLQDGDPLHVVATTSIVADVIANVGGDAIKLNTIVPRMTDPHGYQLTPGDLRTLHDADVVFINGLDLEESLEQSLVQLPDDIPIVSLSEGIQLRELNPEQAAPVADVDPETHAPAGTDPHVWFDPLNIIIWNENAAQSLAALDPGNAAAFLANAAAFHEQIEDLHNWILAQLEEIPQADRKLVTDHLLMGYFAQRYEFEISDALLPAFSSAASPSAQELAAVQDSILKLGVKAIFVGITGNRQLAEQMARDTSVVVIPLYTGALSEVQGPANTYLAFMQYNVRAIATALK